MSSGRAVPDFNDTDFDTEDPVAYQKAIRQRVVEHIVATEEMAELQTQLSQCYYREGVNYRKKCRPLAEEYMKRLEKWKAYIPPEGEETDSVVRMRS
ncbi:Ankyrin repeatcontaining protein [Acanthamoeba castellanii str. Neff]|uniref:Ankyrin repeatcontaining protein n=1 Tax=Acanthamoeba castellanii (strain ATCC 30010 / Neff) TaxID=1257118 RepID=L8H8K4_ACACF|nr:Ankyrin repeatcontaining protein [Acanthamoeba castellanii str. Neff]ELR21552.1 Ankyrin repeatcontaining protein [Acanthamoeba castellanii str. Neff]